MKGWYILSRPSEKAGDSTAWYASFYEFVSGYCNERFGSDWYLSPEASLLQHSGNMTIPRQLIIHAKNGGNNSIALRGDTSIFDYQVKDGFSKNAITIENGLRVLPLASCLVRVSPTFFSSNPVDAQVALSRISDVSEILAETLKSGFSAAAGRMAGALRAVGRPDECDRIIDTMRDAGHDTRESNPFIVETISIRHDRSPYVSRISLMWESMRQSVISAFPIAPGVSDDRDAYLQDVDDRHVEDAYHSLSIEGYRVTEELIAKIAAGKWDPEENNMDKNDRDAMAAKGYHEAFLEVRDSVSKILLGENSGEIARKDHHKWYGKLFAPSVASGILEAKNLAGYRSWPVFIKNARHVPPPCEAIREAMPTFFDLLEKENEPSVRAVLGHFIFVYLHPYGDGNGRMARFLMNAMLGSGGLAIGTRTRLNGFLNTNQIN